MINLILGDCLDKMKEMESNSVDSIVTDPPYGISFMAKKWDYDIPSVEIWKECLRVLKPGGHLLSFGGSRTYHRIAVNIEDAGFDIRDTIMWVYGSGFPKSHNIGKAIDKKLGNEREVVKKSNQGIAGGTGKHVGNEDVYNYKKTFNITKGLSEYEGWGTALKPAFEPIIMARKPFKGDVASNVLQYGTGGINIDGCRVGTEEISTHNAPKGTFAGGEENRGSDTNSYKTHVGRWPANFIQDGSNEVLELFPNTGGGTYRFNPTRNRGNTPFFEEKDIDCSPRNAPDSYGDSGSAARYFYCAKASKKDRNEGCEDLEEKEIGGKGNGLGRVCETCGTSILKPCECPDRSFINPSVKNNHPTVKPIELMRYLCRLVTPKNGIILDPFMGSGSTGKASLLEDFSFIGIEMDPEYYEIAKRRVKDGK